MAAPTVDDSDEGGSGRGPLIPHSRRPPGLFEARRRWQEVEDDRTRLISENTGLHDELRHAQAEIDRVRTDLARTREDAVRAQAETDRVREKSDQERGAHRTKLAELRARVANLQNADQATIDRAITTAMVRLADLEEQVGAATAERDRAISDASRLTAEAQSVARAAQAEAQRLVDDAHRVADEQRNGMRREVAELRVQIERARHDLVITEDSAMLQEAGIYEYRHRLEDAVAYKARLEQVNDGIKTLVRRGAAILSTTSWSVNGSTTEGRKMVRDFSKLMLRAYNAEADNCVRTMKPHRLASSIDRLDKARDTIAKLGATMHIRIDPGYHSARVQELELTADYLAAREEEKDRIRAERERQRDEDAARREFEREKTRLAKEQAHWQQVQQKWEQRGDDAKIAEAQTKVVELGEAIAGVEAREANIRTGWVYVISNLGAFGEDVVKIGLTRRLDPEERVRELGDASVPFKFDIHALVFSTDAVGLENRLHRELADRRLNRVNLRREFFHATPAEVRDALQCTEARDNLLRYTEDAEAAEWRASLSMRETLTTG